MQTKLTLRMDDALISQAKRFARRSGKSVSEIVADLFVLLGDRANEKTSLPPAVRSLRGTLSGRGVHEGDYRKHLLEKYR